MLSYSVCTVAVRSLVDTHPGGCRDSRVSATDTQITSSDRIHIVSVVEPLCGILLNSRLINVQSQPNGQGVERGLVNSVFLSTRSLV